MRIDATGVRSSWETLRTRSFLSFAISAVIGVAAGLSIADDAGRRYLIGVAAAVQFGIYPVWFGAALVLGLPDSAVVMQRLASFAITVVTICGSAVIAYSALGMRAEEIQRFVSQRRRSR